MDTRLIGRVTEPQRTVQPLVAVRAAELDLDAPPASGHVRVQVAARLADGMFRVLIDGKALKLALPADIKAGDTLELRVVAGGSTPANSAGARRGLSGAGQLIAELLNAPPSPPLRQSQPVLVLPPQTPDVLPAPLARAVERSGLFYESHQARWVNGDFPLERLLEEPQARIGRAVAPTPDPDGQPPAAQRLPADPVSQNAAGTHPHAQTPGVASRLPATREASPESDTSTAPADSLDLGRKAQDRSSEIAAREALPLVRQQLDTLETRQINWWGEIWPGQTMRWQIGEEAEHSGEQARAERAWDSHFELELPALGGVAAALSLSGNRLRVRLSALDPHTVAQMRDAGNELLQALQASGVETISFEVQHRDPVR